MPIDPEVPAAALLETWQHLLAGVPDGWTRAEPGALAVVTGVALPTLNGVCVASLDADAEVVADLLDQVAATGLPHNLLVRPDVAKRVTDLAVARGMTREQLPLMVLEDSSQLGAVQATDGLVIRELVPAEAHLHAQVAAAGFEAPVELFLQLMTPASLEQRACTAIWVKSTASRSPPVSASRSGPTSGSSTSRRRRRTVDVDTVPP